MSGTSSTTRRLCTDLNVINANDNCWLRDFDQIGNQQPDPILARPAHQHCRPSIITCAANSAHAARWRSDMCIVSSSHFTGMCTQCACSKGGLASEQFPRLRRRHMEVHRIMSSVRSGRQAASILPSTRLHLPQSGKWQIRIHDMYCGFRAPGTGKGTHQTCNLIPGLAGVVSNPAEMFERASQVLSLIPLF